MNSPGEYSVNQEDHVRSHQECTGQKKAHLASAYTSQTLTSRNPGLPTAAASHTDIATPRTCTAHKLDDPHHISDVVPYIACNRQKIVTFGEKGFFFGFCARLRNSYRRARFFSLPASWVGSLIREKRLQCGRGDDNQKVKYEMKKTTTKIYSRKTEEKRGRRALSHGLHGLVAWRHIEWQSSAISC